MGAKKVLIVEDDAILANALAGAVKKAGYSSLVCQRPEDAIAALDKDSFKLVFIDCLLPQTPGVDLARNIRKNFDSKILPIVMMSGIFTDKQMMKEISQEVAAVDFLKKPFEINEVLKFLEKESATVNDESLARSHFSLPDKVGANPSRAADIFKEIDRIHGYELPLLVSAATASSYTGVIHFLSERDEKSKVLFNHGSIVGVESPDTQNFIGKILVAGGWVLPEDLEFALQQPPEHKIGQRLVNLNFISPHAINEALEQQLSLRLGRLIQDGHYVVNFEEREVVEAEASIEPEVFYHFLDEWITAKVSGDWLNQHFVTWQDYVVRLGPGHDRNRREYQVQSIQNLKDLISVIEAGGALSQINHKYYQAMTEFNRAIYYLLCMRFIVFGEKAQLMSEGERTARLQKIWSQMRDLNLLEVFQMIGGRKDMDAREIHATYGEFMQRHLGATPHPSANEAYKIVYESVREKVNSSYELYLDPEALAQYERELETGKVSQRTEAQAKAEEAKKLLSMKQYPQAMVALNRANELFPKLDFLLLYSIWARIGLLVNSKNKLKELSEIDQMMARVPSEEKLSAMGNFIQGLLAKGKGETAVAKKFFESALAIDKNLIEARRELNAKGMPVVDTAPKKQDLLHGDLGQVIGSLFKKS